MVGAPRLSPRRRITSFAAGLLQAATLLWASGAAWGQISPGPLSRPHAALEGSNRCLDCHSSRKGVDPGRCLACHAGLGQRIRQGQGLHARPEYRACERCHIEHQGRDLELVWWGEKGMNAFDHAKTGYRLAGAHSAVPCRSCHRPQNASSPVPKGERTRPDRTFLGLSPDCRSCHKDPHAGQFGSASCASCHQERAWKPALFDHEKSRFPLTGKHRAVSCERCHAAPPAGREAAARFRGTSSDCAACHRDPHQRRFGARCESCHRTDDWKRINASGFDHRRTQFPLEGRHAAVSCEACHRPGKPMRIPGFERCSSCHADPHLGQFVQRPGGGECAACHGVAGFRPSRFTLADHETTAYPLAGAHRSVACAACHPALSEAELQRAGVVLRGSGRSSARAQRFRFSSTACESCHRDPHGGDGTRRNPSAGCTSCHSLTKWSAVAFDHAPTGFELNGAHRAAPCTQCHRPAKAAGSAPRRIPFAGAPRACSACHADAHGGQFVRKGGVTSCETCHTAWDWQPSRFDHDRDSAFKLEGAHRAVACIGCHPTELMGDRLRVRYRPVTRACQDCHAVPEPHG